MSYAHNILAFEAGEVLLSQLRSGDAAWAGQRLSSKVTLWPGIVDWPVPDKIFEDDLGATLAIEFKPPGQSKREYVTGLGQTLTYLTQFAFVALVVPERSEDGFPIAEYLADVLNQQCAKTLPIGLFSYAFAPTELKPLVHLRDRQGPPADLPTTTRRAFWAYVRDASYFDVYEILFEIDRAGAFDAAYASFWNRQRTAGKALTLEGTPRKPKAHRFSEEIPGDRAERTNVNLLMRHIGLIDSGGQITESGYRMLRHGKVYTPHSQSFMQMFARILLTVGKHLDLILWVDKFQRLLPPDDKNNHDRFKHRLDEGLEADGYIREAPKGRAKPTYFRDEPKYWNRLGLLQRDASAYFHPGVGYVFDWRAIISAVDRPA